MQGTNFPRKNRPRKNLQKKYFWVGEFFYDILLLKSASKEAFEAQNRQKKISIFFTGQKKSRRCENRAYKPQIKVRKFSVVVVGKKLNEQRKC